MPGRISEMAALTGAVANGADFIEALDVSDTSMAATGTNKRFTLTELIVFLRINNLVGLNQAGLAPNPGATSTGRFLKDDGTWTLPPSAVSAVGGVFPFMYSTTITEPPTGSQLRGNNATFTASTKLWVMETNVDGLNVAVGLSRIKLGHQVYIQDWTDAAKYVIFNVTADSVDRGTYWELSVAVSSSSGTVGAGKVGLQSISPAAAGLLFSTTTTAPGMAPGSNGAGATSYLNGVGAWTVPAGGEGGDVTGTKMTDLTAQTGAGLATTDVIETVDISDTTMHATGTNKKLAMSDLITFLNANGIGGGISQAAADTRYVNIDGDTLTGPLLLSAAPTLDLHAATKKYVDDNAGGGGGTVVKVSALTAMGAASATGDLIEVVDISDTTMAPTGTNKKLMLSELVQFLTANLANASIAGAKLTNDSVTNTQLATMNTLTLKGNGTGGTAGPTDLGVYAVQGMLRRPIVANTGTSINPVLATHENVMVTMSNASAQTITLPNDATSNFPIGSEIDFLWLGVGQPAFTVTNTVSESGWLKIRARYTAVTAKKIAANTWVLLGALAA